MRTLTLDISMSLDGFIAGRNQTLEAPPGEGGERLHEWAFAVASFREMHGLPGGETNVDNDVAEEALRNTGATVMGRRMFSGGEGPWEDDPNADGWWGELVIVDFWTDRRHVEPLFAALMAGEFLVLQGGDVFSEDEAKDWLAETGWQHVETLPLEGPLKAVVGGAI